ncbi:MAG: hypothetical protein LAO79_17610 [Acidobacteriia bacterium]|nr:hypothetical protein [Terriglobia bacterium]
MADSLPAYCGPVGAKNYTPPAVNIPPVILNRGTLITVTNATIAMNGDTSSVKALVANPGPDGISLYEALAATNNDPGTWVIQFATALKGSTIDVDSGGQAAFPPFAGGNVTLNGDIDGDGQPDITLKSTSGNLGVYVVSGGNTLNGLALQGCGMGGCVTLRTPSASGGLGPGPAATGKTFAGTTISNLVMTSMAMQGSGILICPNCGPPVTSPTGNTWDHVLITGNTISGSASGPILGIGVQVAWGDTLQHTTIANNSIVLPAQGTSGISFNAGTGLGPLDQGPDIVLDTRVINNTVTAPEGIAFRGTTMGSLHDGVQVIGNHISSSGPGGSGAVGIIFHAADPESGLGPNKVQRYDDNVMKNLAILANTIEGTAATIAVLPGQNAAANNAISNVAISGNTLLNTQTTPSSPTTGILIRAGGSDGSAFVASGNSLSNVLIQANTVQSLAPPGNINFAGGMFEYAIESSGISVTGGFSAQGNSINGISIANNDVNTPQVGIAVTGGSGSGASSGGGPVFSADGNVVAGVQIFCNQLDQVPTQGVLPSSGINAINVAAGLDDASGNQVQQLYVADNLIAGVLAAASTSPYLGSGGSNNTLTTSSTPTPAISLVANAEGETPLIAPNTWIEIKGVNLAPHADALALRTWTASDFVNSQMPAALDGVGVTVNGKSAYVFYVSPSQINVLTPPDAITGPVNVIVTNNGVQSAPYAIQSNAISPSFFVFDGAHVIGVHLDGTDIGPATLYPGLTTPAKPGETIVLFANGFGSTSTPAVAGAQSQSGTLSPMPVITIGGVQANVRFAGLNLAPGQFQFNVDVPASIPDGDQPIVAAYKGVATQAGVLLTVKH